MEEPRVRLPSRKSGNINGFNKLIDLDLDSDRNQIGALDLILETVVAHYSANGLLNIVVCFGINQVTGFLENMIKYM